MKINGAWNAIGLPKSTLESFSKLVTDDSTVEEIKEAWHSLNLVPSYLGTFIEEFQYESLQKEETRKANEAEGDRIFKEALTNN
jgi:hypothetical protein